MTSSRPSRARFGGLFAAHCFANGTPNRQNTEHKTVRLDPLTGSFRTRSRPVRTLFRPVLLTFWAKVMLEREKFSTSLGSNSRTASLPKGALRSLYPRPHRPADTHKVLRRGPPDVYQKKKPAERLFLNFPMFWTIPGQLKIQTRANPVPSNTNMDNFKTTIFKKS